MFIIGRRQSELDKTTMLLGGSVHASLGDITVMEDLHRFYDTVRQQAGRLDILVANSGMADALPLDKITADHFDKTFDLNARATLFTVQRRFR